jgi:hypothetical protein
MSDREVILNLWYVRDEEGLIYSLRVRAYVAEGSEEDKLTFLQERARLDYLIADPFPIPEPFHLEVRSGDEVQVLPVAHVMMLQDMSSPVALFEEAIKDLESRMPGQSGIGVPEDPLVCTTALTQNGEGVIEPRIDGQFRY